MKPGFEAFFQHLYMYMYDIFTYPKAPGLSLGGSGVSIGGVRILRVQTWSLLGRKRR